MALRIRHRAALQLADDIASDTGNLGQLHRIMPLLRPEGPSCGGNTYAAELTAQPGLHPLGHPAGHLGHLIDILNLAVQHGTAAMLFLLNGQDLQTLVRHPARYADDAAGPDIQRINQAAVLRLSFRHPATSHGP